MSLFRIIFSAEKFINRSKGSACKLEMNKSFFLRSLCSRYGTNLAVEQRETRYLISYSVLIKSSVSAQTESIETQRNKFIAETASNNERRARTNEERRMTQLEGEGELPAPRPLVQRASLTGSRAHEERVAINHPVCHIEFFHTFQAMSTSFSFRSLACSPSPAVRQRL